MTPKERQKLLKLLMLAGINVGLWDAQNPYPMPQNIQTCNMTEEEIAERDRPISRQERRQIERLKRKGRA